MKPSTLLVSLLSAIAPLASACTGAEPLDMPMRAMAFGMTAASPEAAAEPLAVEAKTSAPASAHLLPREATPFGKSYEEWAAAWWQWSLAVPRDENPILGGPCEVDQSGNVFFLAGNTGGSESRSCTIPPGKALFFPLVNLFVASCPENVAEGWNTCENTLREDYLHESATYCTDIGETTLTLTIDGVSVDGLEEYRAHSPSFDDPSPAAWDDRAFPQCTGPIRENPCGVPVGSTRTLVADGYWVMLHPLPVGEHQIQFTGFRDFGGGDTFGVDLTYDIVVAP